jgi:hypothetical protein
MQMRVPQKAILSSGSIMWVLPLYALVKGHPYANTTRLHTRACLCANRRASHLSQEHDQRPYWFA